MAVKVRELGEERLLVFWDVVELGMDKHIIGFDIGLKQARFSTPIIKLDLHSNTAITRSGTRYRFLSAPGRLHPYAKRLLKKLFNNSPLRYTLKYSHPDDKRISIVVWDKPYGLSDLAMVCFRRMKLSRSKALSTTRCAVRT